VRLFSLYRLRRAYEALGFQLGLAVGCGVLFACLLVTTGVLLRTAGDQHKARMTEMQTYANVLSAGIANAMSEGNMTEVTRTLNAIATARGIEFAAAYDPQGRQVAGIGMQAVLMDTRDGDAPGAFDLFSTRTVTTEATIRKSGRRIGTLRIAGEMANAGAAFMAEMKNAALWAVLAIFIGMFVGLVFQRRIVRPLEQLTTTFSSASGKQHLPEKFEFSGPGEIGVLVGAYNTMIGEISSREAELTNYRQHLEELVDVRTSELRSARDEAEAATKAKSTFLATMSHEIRTPMNGLLVMAELLERSTLPPDALRHASTIARSGRSLMHLLNDIMDFSKMEAGRIELEEIDVSLDELVSDRISLFWEQARSKGIELTAYIAPDVPKAVTGDPTRLGQCIANLLGNAIKFTAQGHVAISVVVGGDGMLQIGIRDTGIGIPEDRIPIIFEAFSQADQSTTRSHGGTGLGLNICAQLAEAMDGRIDVTSRPGEGSCFTLCLPLKEAEARTPPLALPTCIAIRTAHPALGAALERALAARGIATEGDAQAILVDAGDVSSPDGDIPQVGLWSFDAPLPEEALKNAWLDDLIRVPLERADLDALLARVAERRLRGIDLLRGQGAVQAGRSVQGLAGLRVLVADDSPVNREVMAEALAPYDIVPVLANDGVEALEHLTATEFDIAFIDGEMPRLDGFATALKARAAGVGTRLILFSAHSGAEFGARALTSGFDDKLAKPFALDALEAALRVVAHEVVIPDNAASPTEPFADIPTDPDTRTDGETATGAGDGILDKVALDSLRSLDSRRPGAMARVLDRFAESLPGALARLCDALGTGEQEAIRRNAHALKSMCLSVGATQMAQTAALLETVSGGNAPYPPAWDGAPDVVIRQVGDESEVLLRALAALSSGGDADTPPGIIAGH